MSHRRLEHSLSRILYDDRGVNAGIENQDNSVEAT